MIVLRIKDNVEQLRISLDIIFGTDLVQQTDHMLTLAIYNFKSEHPANDKYDICIH